MATCFSHQLWGTIYILLLGCLNSTKAKIIKLFGFNASEDSPKTLIVIGVVYNRLRAADVPVTFATALKPGAPATHPLFLVVIDHCPTQEGFKDKLEMPIPAEIGTLLLDQLSTRGPEYP